MSLNWGDVRNGLDISEEDECLIEMQKDLIRAMVELREERGLTQAQVAKMCGLKQSAVARLESGIHLPRIDTMMKVLVPLGYTLRIMPIKKRQ